MKLKLGQYAKRMKKSRYEVLRMIMRGELQAEEVVENGKKIYYIEVEELPKPTKKEPEVIECGSVRIEIEEDRLVLEREGKKEIYKRVG
jgi:hypothetical protein